MTGRPAMPSINRIPDDPTIRWEQAACLGWDTEIFYPPPTNERQVRAAKRICNGIEAARNNPGIPACPIRSDCLRYAFERREEYGVWGGTSEDERRALRRRQNRQRQKDAA